MRQVLVAIIAVILFLGCGPTEPEDNTPPVSYEVTGTCQTVFVTIANEDGGTSQFADVSVPWTYDFSHKVSEGTFVYVSAQNQQDYGSVTVKIYKYGDVFKSSTSSGAYVIATASGTI
ncbi:hypothetical protein J7K19_12905 [bacterium]|nr:hypothetical protein [bacterium]